MENVAAIALNMRRFRAEKNYTQAKLAEESGVSLPSVKALETCKATNPSAKTLVALARALSCSVGDLLCEPPTPKRVRFRANASLQPLRRLNIISSCATWLTDYCDLENALNEPTFFKAPVASFKKNESIQHFAEIVRSELNVPNDAPVVDVASVFGKLDLKLRYCARPTKADIFGLAINESPQQTGIIVFNNAEISTERVIFTTVHEFAHLLLHKSSFDEKLKSENQKEERQADEFASYFLMPKNLFLEKWNENVGNNLVERVLRVKRFFRVSYKVVLRRLNDEQIADGNIYVNFAKLYRQTTGKNLRDHREPNPLSRFDAPQSRFERLVIRAVSEGVVSISRGAEMLRVPTLDFYDSLKSSGGVF